MTVKRLIGCIMVHENVAVQSFGFRRYLPIGKPEIAAEFLNRWGVDEIILLDMDATPASRSPNLDMVQAVASKIFTPLTVGGGVSSLDDFQALLHAGADKVSVNNALITSPELLNAAANRFGSQCIIASVDACQVARSYQTRKVSGGKTMSVENAALLAEEMGAGEILLNSVENDGNRCGYNIDLIEAVGAVTKIPIIAMGGAGHPLHISEAMKLNYVSAVAIGNMLHHTEHSVTKLKAYMKNTNIPVRAATSFDYVTMEFDRNGRPSKQDEKILDELGLINVEDDSI